MNSESVSMLPGEAKQITDGPLADRLNESNHKVLGFCDLTFKINTAGSNEKARGFTFRASVVMLGRLDCNPFTREVIPGEKWYKGVMRICENRDKGVLAEERAFVYEIKTRTGMLGKRGVLCRLTEVLPSGEEYVQRNWSFID